MLVRVTVFVDALIAGTKIHDLPQSLSAYVYPMGAILPRAGVNVCVSAKTGEGMNAWCDFLIQQHQAIKMRDPLDG